MALDFSTLFFHLAEWSGYIFISLFFVLTLYKIVRGICGFIISSLNI